MDWWCEMDKITFKVKWGAPDDPDFPESNPWTCKIGYQGRQLTVPFYMGSGHGGAEPKLEDVLCCLFDENPDSSGSFEDWCSDFGYDPDSRKAERIYRGCVRIGARLHRLFGADFEEAEKKYMDY